MTQFAHLKVCLHLSGLERSKTSQALSATSSAIRLRKCERCHLNPAGVTEFLYPLLKKTPDLPFLWKKHLWWSWSDVNLQTFTGKHVTIMYLPVLSPNIHHKGIRIRKGTRNVGDLCVQAVQWPMMNQDQSKIQFVYLAFLSLKHTYFGCQLAYSTLHNNSPLNAKIAFPVHSLL